MPLSIGIGVDAGTLATGVEYVFANTEASDLAARFTTPPTKARKSLIDNLVGALKTAGVWTKLDALYMLAAADEQAALLNWKSTSFNLTKVDAPVFTADRGFQGDGVDDYLETGFNPTTAPTPQFVQNSAHMGLWSRTNLLNGASSSGEMGAQGVSSIFRSSGASGRATGRPNISTSTPTIAEGAFPGHVMWSRTAAAVWEGYAQGVDGGGGTDATAALSSLSFRIGGAALTSFGVNQIAAAHIGSGLTAGEVTAAYGAMRAYLAAVGAV